MVVVDSLSGVTNLLLPILQLPEALVTLLVPRSRKFHVHVVLAHA